jgi:hypothetical protein
VSTHTPPHTRAGGLHETLHFVPAPTHTPSHSTWFGGHAHAPSRHCSPVAHERPQAPQFLGLEVGSTQDLPHGMCGAGQAATQEPLQ